MSTVPLATVLRDDGQYPLATAVEVTPVFSSRSGFSEKLALKSSEPMLLLDVTGSMEWPAAVRNGVHSTLLRKDLAKAALRMVVQQLQELDTAGKEEEEGGGVMVTTFAGGHGKVVGDFNPANFDTLWARINFSGSTQIVPGWKTMLVNYIDEFAEKDASERPLKLVTLITDGEADDLDEFVNILGKDKDAYVCVILIGCQCSDQVDHQVAVRQFEGLAAKNPRVVFSNFTDCTDPRALADQILNVCRQGSLA